MRPFLTAEWRHLLMLNYAVAPDLLRPYLPCGVELDTWHDSTYVSMVGFLFLGTKVLGLRVPWHGNFEEVNLRFYVRRRISGSWRRGVVFIKEIVPRQLVAAVARRCYNEPYAAVPMRHSVEVENDHLRSGALVEYGWRYRNHWNSLRATTVGAPYLPGDGSKEEFITEHYWGYTAQRNGGCAEYEVEHSRWKVWQVQDASLHCDVTSLYGINFAAPLANPPESAFVAEGSPIMVGSGVILRPS